MAQDRFLFKSEQIPFRKCSVKLERRSFLVLKKRKKKKNLNSNPRGGREEPTEVVRGGRPARAPGVARSPARGGGMARGGEVQRSKDTNCRTRNTHGIDDPSYADATD